MFRILEPPSTTYIPSPFPTHSLTSPVPPAQNVDHPRPTLPSLKSLLGDLLGGSHRGCNISPYMTPMLRVPGVPVVDHVNTAESLEIGKETLQNAGANTTDGGVPLPGSIRCGWPDCPFVEHPTDQYSWVDHINSHYMEDEISKTEKVRTSRCMWNGCHFRARRGGWVNHVRAHSKKFQFRCPMCRMTYASTPALARHLDKHHPLPTGEGGSGSQGTNQ